MASRHKTVSWLPIREESEIRSICGRVAFFLAIFFREIIPWPLRAGIAPYERHNHRALDGYSAKIVFQNVDSLELRRVVNWMRGANIPIFDVTLHFHGCNLRAEWQGEPFDLEIMLPPGADSLQIAAVGVVLMQMPLVIGRGRAVHCPWRN